MKKILSKMLYTICGLCFAATAWADGLTISNFNALPNTATTVSVNMANTSTISGFQFDLVLPSGVSLTSATVSTSRAASTKGYAVTQKTLSDGSIRLVCLSQTVANATFTGTSGEVLKLTLKSTGTGDKTLTLKNQSLTTSTLSEVAGTQATTTMHVHALTATAAKDATCTVAGNKAYWKCSGCNKYYSNSTATTETTLAAMTIAALGHSYGTPAWTWTGTTAATAKVTCSHDASHVVSANATITSAVKTAATCETKGTTTYTAKATLNGKEYSNTKDEQDIAALGHEYIYTDTKDGKHSITCSRCEYNVSEAHTYNEGTCTKCHSAQNFTITFDTDGGSAVSSITVAFGSAITAPVAPTKTGYTFAGWNPALPETMPLNGMITKATWTVNQYKLIYKVDGTEYNKSEVAYGSEITALEAPTKEGYTFSGWSYIPTTMPAQDVIVVGTFSVNSYDVVFDVDGVKTTTSLNYGAGITAPADPTKDGYTFAGWSPALEVDATVPVGGKTYTATWTINQYTINFDTDGGSAVEPITNDYNAAVAAPADPIKEGYTFAGWDPTLPETMPLNGMTAKATWTINKYTITFDTDGGSAVEPITNDYNAAVTAPADPTKIGYTFAGWVPALPETMPLNGMATKATWTVNQYKLIYKVDGAEYNKSEVAYGSEITALEAPTKEGYTFSGWSYIPSTMPAQDVTVAGTFSVNSYDVVFDVDGVKTTTSLNYGAAITVPADPTKDGYTFAGWSPAFEVDATVPVGGKTYTAMWTINQYTITFDTDGGSSIEPITMDYNAAVTAPADPTKIGYTFAGWDPALPETMPLDGMTTNATWTVNQYTITFDTDGGSEMEAIVQDYGTAISAPLDNPTKPGYNFVGWNKEIPATMPAEDTTIKAMWTVKLISDITLSASTLDLTNGESEQLTVTITPDDVLDASVTWTSDNESVATVDEDGLVTAHGVGSATITVTAKDGSGKSASCTVTVSKKTYEMADGADYTSQKEMTMDQLTYTRSFSNGNWQALYVPFAISTEALAENGLEVARLNDVHQYDYEDDGTVDETAVEILRLRNGSTKPNTMYVIRAKEAGDKVITMEDVTLYPAQENSHSVTSWDTEFTFVGTYHTITGQEMLDGEYYALGGGVLHPTSSSANDLKPQRWYMTVTDREGNKKNVNEVKVFLYGEEDLETGIVTLYAQPERSQGIYDLSGRKTSGTQKGVYIKDGKKVIRK